MTDQELEQLAHEALQRKDFALAATLLKSLNNQESEFALAIFGWMYLNGHIGAPNVKLARSYFERGVALGHEEAYYQLALLFIEEKSYEISSEVIILALDTFTDFDRVRYINLLSLVSDRIASEHIERREYNVALRILQSQEEPKSEYALVNLGWLHTLKGADGNKDNKLARYYFERASVVGSVESHFQLGMIELEEGNATLARQELGDGARLGHLPSMSKLAEMLINGEGGAADYESGIAMLKASAVKGHVMSRVRLLKMEIKGTRNPVTKMIKHIKYIGIISGLIQQIGQGNISEYYEFR